MPGPFRIGVVWISNRGDLYLPTAQASYWEYVTAGEPVGHWTIDDSAGRLGMAGAVQTAWTLALDADIDYLLHLEEDFQFVAPVDAQAMAFVLDQNPQLAQMCLIRQAWSSEEIAAGGLLAALGHGVLGTVIQSGHTWTEHRHLFSANPCLIPRRVLEIGWPSGPLGVGNEAGFTLRCLRLGYRFAYWGDHTTPPHVHHLGAERAPTYRL